MFTVFRYLQEQEGIYLEVEARKVAQGSASEGSIGNFSVYFEALFKHGIFHGATIYGHVQVIDNNAKKTLVYN